MNEASKRKDSWRSPVGVGLRHSHFPFLIKNLDIEGMIQVEWFEVITENFIATRGRPWQILEEISERFPISMHGVSLSIGSRDPFNQNYLKKLKEMELALRPILISDHLCWTGSKERNLHNLLPIIYNEKSLKHLTARIQYVQNYLGREIALENLSAYFSLKGSTYSEWDFLATLSKRSGCKIVLDINNVYVNSVNQKFDAKKYLKSIPLESISEIHLAGFSDMGDYLFDTHSCPVYPEVWDLFRYQMRRLNHNVPILVEWDEDIPNFNVLEAEALKAKKIIESLDE